MHVVGVKSKESVDVGLEPASQAVPDALAHHRALLARNGEHVRLDLRQDRLAEAGIQVLARPARLARAAIAQLEVGDAQTPAKRLRRAMQGGDCVRLGRRHAGERAERQRDERMAEEEALDFGERQHAGDAGGALREKIMRAMAEAAFDDLLPPAAVKERRVGTKLDEPIPVQRVFARVDADPQRRHDVPPYGRLCQPTRGKALARWAISAGLPERPAGPGCTWRTPEPGCRSPAS